ncbi:MAG: GntR family transcriptional regulator [Phycisphaeraceae bacterium]|nr:GntR family transcriptional regulator [Phycisphaeraceae bacterium]
MTTTTASSSTPVSRPGGRQKLRAEILQFITDRGLQPGSQLPSEVELAKHLGVARMTLRSALDQLARQHVLERRHGVGTFVTPVVMTGTIGLITTLVNQPSEPSVYWQWVTRHCVQQARQRRLKATLMLLNEAGVLEEDALSMVRRRQIDGALLLTSLLSPQENYERVVLPIERAGIPVVGVARDEPSQLYRTLMDYGPLFQAGCEHLRQAGHTRVGVWLPKGKMGRFYARKWEVVMSSNLAITNFWNPVEAGKSGWDSIVRGREWYRQWKSMADRPTALFSEDNYLTLGFMYEQLADIGHIPREPAWVVVESQEATLALPWPATRVRVRMADVYDKSLDILSAMLDGRPPEVRETPLVPSDLQVMTC